jgi:hypothetical protein
VSTVDRKNSIKNEKQEAVMISPMLKDSCGGFLQLQSGRLVRENQHGQKVPGFTFALIMRKEEKFDGNCVFGKKTLDRIRMTLSAVFLLD